MNLAPRFLPAVFVLVALFFSVSASSQPAETSNFYTLESFEKDFAFYSAHGFRSYIAESEKISSIDELKNRFSKLPAGARIFWPKDEFFKSQKAGLFSAEQFQDMQEFCKSNKISLVVE